MDLIDYGSSSSENEAEEKSPSAGQRSPSLERQSNGRASDDMDMETDSLGYDMNSTPNDATPASKQAAQDSPQLSQEPKPEIICDSETHQFKSEMTCEGLPPSPPGPCNEVVAERFVKLFKYKAANGINMNTQILNRKEFKNPAIYDKLKEDFGVNEYGTNYLCKDGDNIPLEAEDFYDKLSDEQTKIMERDEQLKKSTPPVQVSATSTKDHRHARK